MMRGLSVSVTFMNCQVACLLGGPMMVAVVLCTWYECMYVGASELDACKRRCHRRTRMRAKPAKDAVIGRRHSGRRWLHPVYRKCVSQYLSHDQSQSDSFGAKGQATVKSLRGPCTGGFPFCTAAAYACGTTQPQCMDRFLANVALEQIHRDPQCASVALSRCSRVWLDRTCVYMLLSGR
jgi:hypothetical protein